MTTKEEVTVSNKEKCATKEDPAISLAKRILCILAHVDHGKTTVADCLLAMAGVVRHSSVGKVRFMDSRADEQQKGITMKTAGFSMKYDTPANSYIFTVVDTPGHVDFSKEVLSAVKSCDGALIVVDVVEGVRAQTREAIQIALEQGLKLILLINKFDRLVIDLKKTIVEVYEYIRRLIESCNMIVSQVCQRNEMDEEEHLFRPESDNIIISSSSDGWGVLPRDVAKLFLIDDTDENVCMNAKRRQLDAVTKYLFDPDCYMSSDRTVKRGAIRKNKSCLFLNMVVRPLYDIYYKLGIRMHKGPQIIAKISDVMKIQITNEMRSNQPRIQISAVLRTFSPLGDAIVRASISVVPDARFVPITRIHRMLYGKQFFGDVRNMTLFSRMMLKLENTTLDIHLQKPDPNDVYWHNISGKYPEWPCLAYVSKIISVPRAQILADPKLHQKQIVPRRYKRVSDQASSVVMYSDSTTQCTPTLFGSPTASVSAERTSSVMDSKPNPATGTSLKNLVPYGSDMDMSTASSGSDEKMPLVNKTPELTAPEDKSSADCQASIPESANSPYDADNDGSETNSKEHVAAKVQADLSTQTPYYIRQNKKRARESQQSSDSSLENWCTKKMGCTSTPKEAVKTSGLPSAQDLQNKDKQKCCVGDLAGSFSNIQLSLEKVKQAEKLNAETQTSPDRVKTDVETQTEDEVSDGEASVGSLATIAIVRIFYGKVKKGDNLILLQSGYQPPLDIDDQESNAVYNRHRMLKFKIKQIYILNGRDVIKTSEAGEGVICGIGFDHVPEVNGELLRSGTIVNCELFYPVYETPQLDPVLRVSVMPVDAKHMILLGNALKWLKQCDSVVKVTTDENGEYVFLSSGDVHLSKIMVDLKNYLNDVPLVFSDPIVKIRETVLNPISTDIDSCFDVLNENVYRIELPEYEFFIEVFVAALPAPLAKLIEDHRDLLVQIEGTYDWGYMRRRMAVENNKHLRKCYRKFFPSVQMNNHVLKFEEQLLYSMEKVIQADQEVHPAPYRYTSFTHSYLSHHIWTVGHYAQTECSNILLNRVTDYNRSIFDAIDETDKRSLIDSCIVNAFHETVKSGPICNEPVTRCVFVVKNFNVASYDKIMNCGVNISTITTQITNACTAAMKGAMLKQTVRLMEPVMESEIPIASAAQTGLVNNIIEKRNGKVVNDASMNFDETRYGVIAKIPAINCANFANEIRQATSGFADAFLTYSGYWMVDGDPLVKVPKPEDDDDDDILMENRAYDLRNAVRRRKGLAVGEQVVASGEKQRTLSKKK